MSDLKLTTAGDYMTDKDVEKWSVITSEYLPDPMIHIPQPVGAWDLGNVLFSVTRRPTDEQIKNTEEFFGWKWVDYENK